MRNRVFRSRFSVFSPVFLLLLSGLLPMPTSSAAPVTFADVAPIFYANCLECHRPGEVAPMSLRSYEEARPWAKAIKEVVHSRKMPPWFADPNHGRFANDARLSEEEIDQIVRWVDQGAKRGSRKDLPPMPEFTEGWQLGEPDHIITLPEVNIPAEGADYFPNLSFTIDIPERRWVRAVEVRPSNREVAHHVVLFSSRGAGMSGSGGFFDVLAVWAVGTPPSNYPEGTGRWVEPGDRITTNMHYHLNGTAQKDQTRIGLYFGKGELKKEVKSALAGNLTFEIPAGARNHELIANYIIDQDVQVISFFPHMHLRGKDMKLTAYYPDGNVEVLLSVPEYDFDWQLYYVPEEPVDLPRGTRVEIVAHYDNSADNPDNPDPSRNVRFGLQSTDEMMFGLFEFVAKEGVSPVPVSDETRIQALLDSLPGESIYKVSAEISGRAIDTALYLPREGDGTWYIPFMGQLLSIALDDIEWTGDDFRYTVALNFGPMSARLKVVGNQDADGTIHGEFEESKNSALAGLLPFTSFDGAPAERNGRVSPAAD